MIGGFDNSRWWFFNGAAVKFNKPERSRMVNQEDEQTDYKPIVMTQETWNMINRIADRFERGESLRHNPDHAMSLAERQQTEKTDTVLHEVRNPDEYRRNQIFRGQDQLIDSDL